MNSKNNRVNHNFQIDNFLAGSCHTADGAWSLLMDLREDRANALALCEAGKMRGEANLIRARRRAESADDAERLEGLADLAEAEAMAATEARNVAGAKAELAHIEDRLRQLQPQRKYAHLPDAEAHEAAQYDEWKLELLYRAENSVLARGGLDPELLSTMRMHPAFASELWPAVIGWQRALESKEGQQQLIEGIASQKRLLLSSGS